MEFKYIYIGEIEGDDKLEVSRTLKDCQDITLFEQEAIQHIIDYKWETYGRFFFLFKFCLYLVFLIVYYTEIENLSDVDDDDFRVKGIMFYTLKAIGMLIQSLFLLYEIVQMFTDGEDYFTDPWNYLELLGNAFYFLGAWMEIS